MARSPLKSREITLLILPCVLIGTAGWFFTRWQKVQQLKEVQNQSGPYRTVITHIESAPLTPFEVWQGFDTKIIVYAKEAGHLETPKDRRVRDYLHNAWCNASLSGTVKGHKKSFPITTYGRETHRTLEPYVPGILRQLAPDTRSAESAEQHFTFLASTSSFDKNAPVTLQGSFNFDCFAYPNPGFTGPLEGFKPVVNRIFFTGLRAKTQPGHFSSTVRRVGEVKKLPTVDHTIPQVVKVQNQIINPYYRDYIQGESGQVIAYFKDDPLLNVDINSPSNYSSTVAQLFDSAGNPVVVKERGSPLESEFLATNQYGKIIEGTVNLPIERVPLQRGQLTMKLAFAPNNGWPVLIQTVVRPAWLSRRPSTLTLKQVSIHNGDVTVNLHYNGPKTLIYPGDHSVLTNFFDEGNSDWKNGLPSTGSYTRLFTDGSQHLIWPDGQIDWDSESVRIGGTSYSSPTNYSVVYKTRALKTLKPGQKAVFRTNIGVEGDGMLPIQAVIIHP